MQANTNNGRSWTSGRTVRIGVAVGVAGTLGLADLWLTMFFMRTTGMHELNPLARLVVGFGPAALVAMKITSLFLNAGILLACRKRLAGELGAWASVAVMVALTAHWNQYVNSASEMTGFDHATLAADHTFVKIDG